MSMKSSFIYGFGFNCDCDETKLIEFVKAHKHTFCKSEEEIKMYEEMLQYTEKQYDLEDFFEGYPCDLTGVEGTGAVIANIMSRETGISFIYCVPCDDCDTYASVIYEVSYPWQLNEIEKKLSKSELEGICKKYTTELGILDDPDFLELEYYG